MRDRSRVFPTPSDLATVVTARVWHCKYATLAPLSDVTNLEGLAIATYPDDSFDLLTTLRKLRYLSVVHLPRVKDLQSLAELSSIETLSLSTLPSWDSANRRSHVATLLPLRDMPRLRHVELLGVVPQDDSMMTLADLPMLETARLHGYPKSQTAEFFTRSRARDAHAPAAWF